MSENQAVKIRISKEIEMKTVSCPSCGARMKRNGKTGAGAQRWRCGSCGASTTLSYDDAASRLGEFLAWLTSKDTQLSMAGQGRTFRRRTAEFWRVWPMPEPTGEVHRALFVDGIWLARDLVVLIAYDGEHVVSWCMAQSETSRAWEALVAPVPAPDVVVCDGGTGFERARRRAWPRTRVQRCVFHAFCQVRRYTTSRPRLQAGRELCALSIELMHLETLRQADWWAERYPQWCSFWADFLEDVSIVDGRRVFTHERLRKARSSLSRLVSAGTLFTYLDPALTAEGPLPRTNNPIEGGVNAQLRDMLRNHRGMSSMRRVKAVFWWCYLHAESPKPVREALGAMPTDDDIDLLYRTYSAGPKRDDGGPEWGDRVVWEELHHRDPYPFWLD